MAVTCISPARIQANRQNALKSTGPKTVEGKAQSRRNGLKHGMTGSGVVLASDDVSEVERRAEGLLGELAPQSILGRVLVGQLATLSVRMERGAKQEEAGVMTRVRHAAEVFDRDRLDGAEELFEILAEDPKSIVRDLRRSPEGIDLLIQAWGELRDKLTRSLRPEWSFPDFELFARLLGLRPDDRKAATLKVLSQASWGFLGGLTSEEGAGLDDAARQAWARTQLVERIEAELDGLEEDREALDLRAIELDRLAAADLALFDPSREASLARRYEAEARRGFFRALREFRKVEAEAADRPEADSVPETEPLASSCAGDSPTVREPKPGPGEGPEWSIGRLGAMPRGLDGRVVAVGRGVAIG